ncbi:MAG: hypothetical protein ABIW76_23655 [Fibrobacteria bacterium]
MAGSKPPPHPITSAASVVRLYVLLLREPRLRRPYLRLLRTIFRTYFLPQFRRKPGHVKVRLDLALDALVPFDPTWLPCYLGFVRLWVGSLGWLHRRFGDRALPEMVGFVAGLERLFLEASRIFSVHDSTLSSRPGPHAHPDSLVIHLTDRNSFCFPSLHVMIVRFNARWLAGALDRLGGPDGPFAAEKSFLEERSARIIESIIHVKQHSLSDIPAGLFLLHAAGVSGAYAPLAGKGEAAGLAATLADDYKFMESLFRAPEQADCGESIRAFMQDMYLRLHGSRSAGKAAHEVLLEFLGDYEREVGVPLHTGDSRR